MMQQQKPKRIPYGMQNWQDVRQRNCYYVDKTMYLPMIEAADDYFFFIRPRRFGKTLLINMLEHYYDVQKADLFDELFGDLWIGKHPTEGHNKYLVLYLNFSAFSGSLDDYQERMDDYCNLEFESFVRRYAKYLPSNALEMLKSNRGAANQLLALARICQNANQQIYMLIDEYDHFTNIVLSDPDIEERYKAETHGSGAFRTFFNAIKNGAVSSIKKLFITGVSPVTMDDLTSGFNIGTNYTSQPEFNGLLGFTETEVREMLDYYRQHYEFNHSTDELIEIMKPWYDNYCFSEKCLDEPPMYNSDMVLYFVNNYTRYKCRVPKDMLDNNIRTDYSKLRMLIRKDREFNHDASIVQQIVQTGSIVGTLKESFPSESIADPDNFVSLLYYFGLLTIAGTSISGVKFRIPNQVVREQMYNYLTGAYRVNDLYTEEYPRLQLMARMAGDGDWKPYFEYIADVLRRFSSNRDKQKGEAFVHGFTLSQTCLTKLYMPISELDAGARTSIYETAYGGYADIYMQPMLEQYPDIEHSYVIELKYLAPTATDAEVAAARTKAAEQLTRYAEAEVVARTKGHTTLHRLILLWRGIELAVAEEL